MKYFTLTDSDNGTVYKFQSDDGEQCVLENVATGECGHFFIDALQPADEYAATVYKFYPQLNREQLAVMDSVVTAASANGYDFGLTDEVHVAGMNRNQIGGHLAALQAAGIIDLHEETVNDDEEIVQIELHQDFQEALHELD